MSLTAECNVCGRRYQAPDEMAGKQVRCKQCGNVFLIASAEEGDLDLDALAAAEQNYHAITIPPTPRGDASDHEDKDQEEDGEVALAPLQTGRMNVRFAFPFAKEVDQALPIVLSLGAILLLGAQCYSQNQTGVAWMPFAWVGVALLSYLLLIVPATLSAIRKAGRNYGYQMPRNDLWRTIAAYLPAFALGYIMWIAGEGWPPALLLGCLAGVALSTAALWILFRLQPHELAPTGIYAGVGFFIGLIVAGGLMWGINMLLINIVIAAKQTDSLPASPIASVAPWITPEQKETLAQKMKPTLKPQINSEQVAVVPVAPPKSDITNSPIVLKADEAPIKQPFDEVLRPLTASSYVGLMQHGSDILIELCDTNTWNNQASQSFGLDPNASLNHYILSPDGQFLARIATFPRLCAQVLTFGNNRPRVIDLDSRLGTPELVGFTPDQRMLVHRQGTGPGALEVIDLKPTNLPPTRIDTPSAPIGLAINKDASLGAVIAVGQGSPVLYIFDLVSGKQIGIQEITSIDQRWAAAPSGIAFSDDSSQIAVLFEAQGNALLLSYQIDRGKAALNKVAELVFPTGMLPGVDKHCYNGNPLVWLPDGSGWLVYGQGILEGVGGSQVADLGVSGVESARFVQPDTVELIRQNPPGGPKQIDLLHLDMDKISSLIRKSAHG
jgi:hypothetical protein